MDRGVAGKEFREKRIQWKRDSDGWIVERKIEAVSWIEEGVLAPLVRGIAVSVSQSKKKKRS
jgi:hypothetical protein